MRADLTAETTSVDPTVQDYAGSPGCIDCGSDEYLCIGSTGFQQVLANLAHASVPRQLLGLGLEVGPRTPTRYSRRSC